MTEVQVWDGDGEENELVKARLLREQAERELAERVAFDRRVREAARGRKCAQCGSRKGVRMLPQHALGGPWEQDWLKNALPTCEHCEEMFYQQYQEQVDEYNQGRL